MEMREYIEAIAESCRKLIISKPATKQEEYRKIIVQKKESICRRIRDSIGRTDAESFSPAQWI